jgi:hypothetical protein
LHGLGNFCNTRSAGDAPWWWYLSVAIFYVLYATWLLRQSGSSNPAPGNFREHTV